MTARPNLADRLALALLEHGPTSCERLARLLGARTATVRRTLRADARFDHVGAHRGSRWRLVLPAPDSWDGLGRNLPPPPVSDVAARLAVVEERLGRLERLLAPPADVDVDALPGQLTVDEVLAAAANGKAGA